MFSTDRSRVLLDSPLRDASWVNITPGRSPEGEFLVSHRETMKLTAAISVELSSKLKNKIVAIARMYSKRWESSFDIDHCHEIQGS